MSAIAPFLTGAVAGTAAGVILGGDLWRTAARAGRPQVLPSASGAVLGALRRTLVLCAAFWVAIRLGGSAALLGAGAGAVLGLAGMVAVAVKVRHGR